MIETLLKGRYKVIQVLGSGGFGQTYIAQDMQQADLPKCVVKLFQPSRQDESFLQIARRLFASEVETLRKLGSHSQIPSLWDDFEENQEFYLVQEYVEGQLLSDELFNKRLDEAGAIALLHDVLHVLEFVHHNQVIHRDIKPGNLIRRQQDSKYVLIDFGAVKEIQTQLSTEPGLTNLTVGIGTQGYGPSEQMMGKPRYSSDLYALGMTVIHALTGLQPAQLPTHPNTGEAVWLDLVNISPKLAAILTRMTRYHFSQRYQSATEVLAALDSPTELVLEHPTEVPDNSLTEALIDITQIPQTQVNDHTSKTLIAPAGEQTDTSQRKKANLPVLLGMVSLTMSALVLGIRQLGWLQPLELAAYDRMVQISPDRGADLRLLVVGITEADIQKYEFPLADGLLAQAIKKLKTYQPRAIGLDLLRNKPVKTGNAELLAELNAPNVIAIANLGSSDEPNTPAPPNVPARRVGFNDLVLDSDGVVRRNLMLGDSQKEQYFSFALQLALLGLADQGITLKNIQNDPTAAQLGKTTFHPLSSNAGGYQGMDDRGYQTLLKYRSRNPATAVSLEDLLTGRVKPEQIKQKIVLIGTTARSAKDQFFTPYSSSEKEFAKMSGVMLHAQMVSQFLDAGLEGRSQFWFLPEWAEVGWIVGWTVAGVALSLLLRHPLKLCLGGTVLILLLVTTGFGISTQMGWVPIAAPIVGAIVGGCGGIITLSQSHSLRKMDG